jgi:hypothetical protein
MLRIGDVAFALDMEGQAFRKWITRGRVRIREGSYGPGGWAEFTWFDLCVFALIREMVNFGVDLELANQFAHRVIRDFGGWTEEETPEQLWKKWSQQLLIGRDHRGKWICHVTDVAKGEVFYGGYLVIKVGEVLQRAIERAEQAVERRQETLKARSA